MEIPNRRGSVTVMRVINRTRQTMLVENGRVASTPWSRLVGLLGRRSLEPGDGLLLVGEQAIHTGGMLFAIDVAYLDRDGRVLRAIGALVPYRLGPFVRGARNVLELPQGTLAATHTREGDELDIEFTC
jgi:uncharacterized protein